MESIFETVQTVGIVLLILLSLFAFGKIVLRKFGSRFAPVKTAKAQVVDKFKNDKFTKIYSASAKPATYTVVFQLDSRKRSFEVSEFSWKGYKVGTTGTLKYQGSRLIDFH